jgi:UDP-N-acetylmuramyl pentapeptide phosphotransferase/UDP-N-acetylglucosamine-1-phosphate transferase
MVVLVLFLPNIIGTAFRHLGAKVIAMLCASTFVFFIGLVDDIKNLRTRAKLFFQLIAAIFVCSFGIRIHSIAVPDLFTLNLGWLSWPLTIFWILGVTNAVNIIDGLDGLAAGISAIACSVIAVLAIYFGQSVLTVIMLALLGSLTGFLFFNFNPAKIFMGDCGSLFLGFIIASSSVMCTAKSQALVGLTLPLLALGIPIFDTLFSMLRRFLERRSIFSPDSNHFHHRLLKCGFCQRHAVIIAYVVTLLTAGLGMFMIAARSVGFVIIFACILLLTVLVFRAFGLVRLRETIEGLRKKYAITCQVKEELYRFDNVQLHFRQATTFDDWWQSVCLAADKMDFAKLALSHENRDGAERTLTWQSTNGTNNPETVVKVTIPIQHLKDASKTNFNVDVHVNGSFESAGRKVTLFCRLVDEYGFMACKKQE